MTRKVWWVNTTLIFSLACEIDHTTSHCWQQHYDDIWSCLVILLFWMMMMQQWRLTMIFLLLEKNRWPFLSDKSTMKMMHTHSFLFDGNNYNDYFFLQPFFLLSAQSAMTVKSLIWLVIPCLIQWIGLDAFSNTTNISSPTTTWVFNSTRRCLHSWDMLIFGKVFKFI